FLAATGTPRSIRSKNSGATRRSERSTKGPRTCSLPRSRRRSSRTGCSFALPPRESLQKVVRDAAGSPPQRQKVNRQRDESADPGQCPELRRMLTEERPHHEREGADDADHEDRDALRFGRVDIAIADQRHGRLIARVDCPGYCALHSPRHRHPPTPGEKESPVA